jgi:CelD/BcsL family acetyltransferase involved in cellulose biosynthesis
VRVIVAEAVPEDQEIQVAWNNLVFRMERPEVFFTQQWALAASRAFSTSLSPKIFLTYEADRLVGIAAMAVTLQSPGTAFFLTASTADYCDIVSAPETRDAIVKALLERMKDMGLRNLVLANVPAESRTLTALATIGRSQGFHIHDRKGYDCGIIAFGDAAQRQDVLQALFRKEKEKRELKKLNQIGQIRVKDLTGEQLDTGLHAIFAAHVSRFLATNRLSSLIHSERRLFLIELSRLLEGTGWLRFSQLEVDGLPVAWNYGFIFNASWFWYLPTFLIQYEEFSPGSCLLRLLAEEACADASVTKMDLGLGDEPYKARFCNAVSSTRYVQLSQSLPRHLAALGRYRLASSITSFPSLETQLRNGRSRLLGRQRRIKEIGIPATVRRLLTRARRTIISRDEVAFFEAPQMTVSENERALLNPICWENLALAAMHSSDDVATLEYLARSARRLRNGQMTGYCLLGQEMRISHFLWVAPYNGFHLAELDSTLESRDPSAVILFDCFTPKARRGCGHYATAIRLAAANLQDQQRNVWIFSAVENVGSMNGIVKAGFVYRFSFVRDRWLGDTTISRHASESRQRQMKIDTRSLKGN